MAMLTPNMGLSFRIIYGVLGVAMMAFPFVAPVEGWVRIAVPLLGVLTALAAATGW